MGKSLIQQDTIFHGTSTLLLIFSVSLFVGFFKDGFHALFPFLQGEFGLTRAQIGLYSTFVYSIATFSGLIAGKTVDGKGSRWGMLIGVFSMAILVILHSFSPSFSLLLILAAFTGIGFSFVDIATSKGVVGWFSKKIRGTAMGINSAGLPIGGALGASILPLLGGVLGWRPALFLAGTLLFSIGLLILFFYREYPITGTLSSRKREEGEKKPSFLSDYMILLKNRYLLLLCLLGFVLGAGSGIVTTHFTLFLYLDLGYSRALSGVGFGVLQLGGTLGRPGWGFISDTLFHGNRGKGFLLIGLFLSLISIVYGFLRIPIYLVFVLAFFLGVSSRGWQGLYLTALSDLVGERQTGLVMGFVSIFIRLGLMVGPPLFGYLADIRGSYDMSWLLLSLIVLIISVLIYYYTLQLLDS